MSDSELTKVADRELRDLSAKLRFALLSVVFLSPLGATLTTLGVPRPIAAVVVFAGLALLLLAFVAARVSDFTHVTLEEYERRKIAEILARPSTATVVTPLILAVAVRLILHTIRLANLFSVGAHSHRNADERARG